jgi:replicative DNA helicase
MTRVAGHKFRTGHFTKDESSEVTKALAGLAQLPIWIDDSSSSSMAEIAARAQRLKNETGLALVIVDYIQLVAGAKRSSNRQEEVSDISRALKALAKDLRIPVLALSQLTRAPEQENRRPQLSDLRSSGAIEQDADVVMFIHRPNFYKKTEDLDGAEAAAKRAETELIIAKQRNGPIDDVKFVFQESITRFEERAPDGWDSGLGVAL